MGNKMYIFNLEMNFFLTEFFITHFMLLMAPQCPQGLHRLRDFFTALRRAFSPTLIISVPQIFISYSILFVNMPVICKMESWLVNYLEQILF